MNSGANLSPVRKPQAAAPRLYVPQALPEGGELDLPHGAARHAQVLRLQPGDALTLFNGEGGECRATIIRMGRSSVQARIGAHAAIEREAARMPPKSTRTGKPWPRWRCWRESLFRVCP